MSPRGEGGAADFMGDADGEMRGGGGRTEGGCCPGVDNGGGGGGLGIDAGAKSDSFMR